MKKIGFMFYGDTQEEASPVVEAPQIDTPTKSLVKIHFPESGRDLSYYNDRFTLAKGDVVYVSGKMAGEAGVVVSVSTKFRIHTADYQKVIAKLDLEFHGDFIRLQDKMVSLDDVCITPAKFESWVIPPVEEKKKKDEDEDPDEIISGEGYTIDLNNIEACEDLTEVIGHRAIDYCMEGRVRYLSIQGGKGCAFVEGTKWYRVDFRYEDGLVTDLFCDCPYPGLCKHAVAVVLNLRMLSKQPEMKMDSDFVALDRWLFWKLASRSEKISV